MALPVTCQTGSGFLRILKKKFCQFWNRLKTQGDEGLRELARKFDDIELADFAFSEGRIMMRKNQSG